MYDLETIRRLNEAAHFRHIELSRETEVEKPPPQKEPPPPLFPLSVLARKLLGGPPSLTYFIELIESSDSVMDFLTLIREYLPEHELEIMSESIDTRVDRFSRLFADRYFPLRDTVYGDDIHISDFVSSIPIEYMGFSEEDYHYFNNFRDGFVLLLALIETPYEDYEEDVFDFTAPPAGGGRVPILERAGEIAGKWLVDLIPPDGWSPDEIHRLTWGTNYDGCGLFADWYWRNTGLYQLDISADQEYLGPEIPWERETVKSFAEEWPSVCDFWDTVKHLAELLESDPECEFRQLMALMLDNPNLIVPKEQLPLPLDENCQVIVKEVSVGTVSM